MSELNKFERPVDNLELKVCSLYSFFNKNSELSEYIHKTNESDWFKIWNRVGDAIDLARPYLLGTGRVVRHGERFDYYSRPLANTEP